MGVRGGHRANLSPPLLWLIDTCAFVAGAGLAWSGTRSSFLDLLILALPLLSLLFATAGMYLPLGQGARASLARSGFVSFLAIGLIWLIAVRLGVGTDSAQRDMPLAVGAVSVVLARVLVRRLERLLQGRQHWAVVSTLPRVELDELVAKVRRHQDLSIGRVSPIALSRLKESDGLAAAGFSGLLIDATVGGPDLEMALGFAARLRLPTVVVPTFTSLMMHGGVTQRVDDLLVVALQPLSFGRRSDAVRRLLDAIIALLLLGALSPVLLVAAIAIRLDSHGPVLFRQERVGLGGRQFRVIKLRTMIDNAESATGPVLATQADPRITRIGRMLRATRLDEVPQLLNVISGDMALVGPRPERPEFVDELSRAVPGYQLRHLTRPGITGLAQVSASYTTSAEDKLRFDLYHMQVRTLWMDSRILLQTVKVAFKRSQASGLDPQRQQVPAACEVLDLREPDRVGVVDEAI